MLAGVDVHIVQIRERNTIEDLIEMGRCERFDVVKKEEGAVEVWLSG